MSARIKRREFLALAGGAAAWPMVARAQQTKMPVIGLLSGRSKIDSQANVEAFLRGLTSGGFIVGQNCAIEYRWANGDYNELPRQAMELAAHPVTVIATTGGTASAIAAKHATVTIPVVFLVGSDPVELGLVASYNRPSGNLTGLSFLVGDLTAKRIELARDLLPGALKYGMLVNPGYPDFLIQTPNAQSAAQTLGRQIAIVNATKEDEIKTAIDTLREKRIDVLIVGSDPTFNALAEKISMLAAERLLPSIAPLREFVVAGGLASYGSSITDAHRQLGIYVANILRGEKPADLPVQNVTKTELVINLKAARTLGISVPQELVVRAEEVIE